MRILKVPWLIFVLIVLQAILRTVSRHTKRGPAILEYSSLGGALVNAEIPGILSS